MSKEEIEKEHQEDLKKSKKSVEKAYNILEEEILKHKK